MNKYRSIMKDFYCYICNEYITHDVFMAHDLAFCCNTHRNIHLRKLNRLENHIIKTKKNNVNSGIYDTINSYNNINTKKNNVNTNIYETINSYNNIKNDNKKNRTCSMVYDYLSYLK